MRLVESPILHGLAALYDLFVTPEHMVLFDNVGSLLPLRRLKHLPKSPEAGVVRVRIHCQIYVFLRAF